MTTVEMKVIGRFGAIYALALLFFPFIFITEIFKTQLNVLNVNQYYLIFWFFAIVVIVSLRQIYSLRDLLCRYAEIREQKFGVYGLYIFIVSDVLLLIGLPAFLIYIIYIDYFDIAYNNYIVTLDISKYNDVAGGNLVVFLAARKLFLILNAWLAFVMLTPIGIGHVIYRYKKAHNEQP